LNCSTLSKDLLPVFMLWFCPAFSSPNTTIYLIFSAFTYRPISFLATAKPYVFFFIVLMLPTTILTSWP
jgi:hypothetical protein